MLKRYLIATVGAMAVTFGLFLFMQSLITMGESRINTKRRTRLADFVRTKRASSVESRKRELPQRSAKQAKAPPTPQMNLQSRSSQGTSGPALNISAPEPEVDVGVRGGPLAIGQSDADTIPMVRVEPMYPTRAAQKGIEGWVEIRFTISATGAVRDAEVIASDPANVFDRAALKAIRKWKYKPRIENGVAVERRGLRVRLKFALSQ